MSGIEMGRERQRRGNARRGSGALLLRYLVLPVLAVLFIIGFVHLRASPMRAAHAESAHRQTRIAMPRFPLPHAGQRIVIFAPHEDDEMIGSGGLILQAVHAGAHVRVVLITNGDSARIPGLFHMSRWATPAEYIHLGYQRQSETEAALAVLGLPSSRVTFLGYPNGPLYAMWLPAHWLSSEPLRSKRTQADHSPYTDAMTPDAAYCGESLLADLETVLRQEQPDLIITTSPLDANADHRTTYDAVRVAFEEMAARDEAFTRTCRMLTCVIHWGQPWPTPPGLHPAAGLRPPAALANLPGRRWFVLPMSAAQVAVKRRAMADYRSQHGANGRLPLSFIRSNELFAEEQIHTVDWTNGLAQGETIEDPVAESPAGVRHPGGDFAAITMTEYQGRLLFHIQTAGPPDPHVQYFLSLHAGGPAPGDRRIALFSFRGSTADGQILEGGRLTAIDPGQLHLADADRGAELDVPWPPLRPSQRFLTLRAWTIGYGDVIDATTTDVVRFR